MERWTARFGRDAFLRTGILNYARAEIARRGKPTRNEARYDYYVVSDVLPQFVRSAGRA